MDIGFKILNLCNMSKSQTGTQTIDLALISAAGHSYAPYRYQLCVYSGLSFPCVCLKSIYCLIHKTHTIDITVPDNSNTAHHVRIISQYKNTLL